MKKYFTHINILLVWAVILYGITLRNQYNIDDNIIIEKNELVQKGIKAIPEIFTSRYVVSANRNYAYRPIPKTLFAIEYSMFGENLFIFHLINLILFLVAIFIIWLFFGKLIGDEYKQVLFWSLLIFISYPANTEVVASLKNVDILLSTIFSFIAFRFYLFFIEKKKLYFVLLTLLFFVLAVLSKLDALLNFAILSLSIIFFKENKIKHFIYLVAILIFSFLIYKSFNKVLLPTQFRGMDFIENPLINSESIITRIATGFWVILFYIKKLIFPFPLSIYYGYSFFDLHKLNEISVLISIFIVALLLFTAFYFRKKQKIISFSILGLIGSLVFYSNIISKFPGGVADRFMLQISFLFFLFLVSILSWNVKKKLFNFSKLLVGVFIIGSIIFGAITIKRNNQWYSRSTLYSTDVLNMPNSAYLNRLHAQTIIKNVNESVTKNGINFDTKDSVKLAEIFFNKAIKIHKTDFTSNYSLALINLNYYKNNKKAIDFMKQAYNSDLDKIDVKEKRMLFYQLGVLLQNENRFKESIKYLKQLVETDSSSYDLYKLLLKSLIKTGDYKETIKINKTLIEKKIGQEKPYINIAVIYLQQGDTLTSLNYYEQAVKENPKNKDLIYRLLEYYKYKKDLKKIKYYLDTYNNLE